MVARHVKRKDEDRPTREMHREELLGLLSAGEREAARRMRARTTVQPIHDATELPPMPDVEHTPLPITGDARFEGESFAIDTRELDARVFQQHGTASPARGSDAIEPVQAPPVVRADRPRDVQILLAIAAIIAAVVLVALWS